jgi:hypothetical protein
MKFAENYVKVKSNWFDKNSVIGKIGSDGFLLYLTLFRYHIRNQEGCMFATSMKMLKKDTGFTIAKTYELFKILVRYGIVSNNVRWDRYLDNEIMFVTALDIPKTTREVNDKEKEYDKPVSNEDHYVSVDMNMMQYYLDNGLKGSEMALYCLIRKYSTGTEKKCWMSINKIADNLGMSNDKVHKMIRNLNRMFLMASDLRKNNKRTHIVDGKKRVSYFFEHHIFANYSRLDEHRESFRLVIEKNIKKWDKQKDSKSKSNTNTNPFLDDVIDSEEVYFEEQEDDDFNSFYK